MTADIATRVPYNLIDPLLNVWIFSWAGHAIAHSPLELFNANIFYPDHVTLAFAESMLGQSLPVAPIYWLTGNGVLTVNIALLLLYVLGSYGAYFLARELGAPRGPAFVAGLAFGLSPYRLSQIVHIHVVALHAAPFVLALLIRLRTRPSRWLVPAIGVTLAYQVWCSLSGGAITACAIAAWAVWEVVTRRRAALPALRSAFIACVIAGILVVPLLLPYMRARTLYPDQYAHPPQEVLDYSAHVSSYLSPNGPGTPLLQGPNRWIEGGPEAPAAWEKHLFPGWTISLASIAALAVGGRALLRQRRGPRHPGASFALTITLTGFLLSLGPRFGADPDGLPLPFLVLTHAPGRLLRVPARFGMLVPLGLALAVAFLLATVPPRRRRPLVAVLVIGVLFELLPNQTPMVPAPAINAAHRSINDLDGAVLALPTVEILSKEAGGAIGLIQREPIHMHLSTAHFRPVVNGYSAFQTPGWWQIVEKVQDFPSANSMSALHRRDVRTVVIETSMVPGTRWQNAADALSRWPGARLVARADGTVVYDISAAADHG